MPEEDGRGWAFCNECGAKIVYVEQPDPMPECHGEEMDWLPGEGGEQ